MELIQLHQGHVINQLKHIPDESVHCVVTSPPYHALRSYGTDAQTWDDGWRGELGSEPTPEMFIDHLVDIFAEIKRVMRNDAVCWINIGDSYNDKQLQLIPQRLTLALQADGWYIRSTFGWYKANSLPESVKDRPSTAHETMIMATKSPKYFYDGDAVRLPVKPYVSERSRREYEKGMIGEIHESKYRHTDDFGNDSLQKQSTQQGARTYNFMGAGRNRRTSDSINESIDAAIEHHQTELARLRSIKAKGGLLTADDMPVAIFVNPKPLKELHYAAFSPKLITPFILTSPKRCCRECGKGWESRVEKGYSVISEKRRGEQTKTRKASFDNPGARLKHSSALSVVTPTGIFPACECNAQHTMVDGYCTDCGANTFLRDAEPCWKPAVVLDPFLGSGTTAIVAAELGRDCIGIELKDEYLEMARQRIHDAVGLII